MSEHNDLPALARAVAERLGCRVSATTRQARFRGHCWFWISGGARRSTRWLLTTAGLDWLVDEMGGRGLWWFENTDPAVAAAERAGEHAEAALRAAASSLEVEV